MAMMKAIGIGCIGLGFMLSAVSVHASTSGGGDGPLVRSWQFQDTGFGAGDVATAVGLRSGLAWPMIFSRGEPAIGLRATPNPDTSTLWHEEGEPLFGARPLAAKSSVDGRVLAASAGPGGRVLVGGSFESPTVHEQAVAGAFDASGQLWLAEADRVIGLDPLPGGGLPGGIVDMAVAPDGTVGVVSAAGRYFENRFGAWSPEPMFLGDVSGDSVAGDLRLTFDAQSRPHVTDVQNGTLRVFSFDTQQGDWTSANLGQTGGALAPIAATSGGPLDGEVGVAWVDGETETLRYSSRDSAGQWSTTPVTDGVSGYINSNQSVGLAFDFDGLPVISFVQDGNTWLAYDPILDDATPGDVNADGVIDGLDIDPFVRLLTGSDPFNPAADVNGDGNIDGLDIDPFVNLLTGGADATLAAIPEPTSIALLSLGGLTTLTRRRVNFGRPGDTV